MDVAVLLTSAAYYLAIAAILVLPILAYGYHWRWRWQLRHIPGPKPSFLMGNWEFVLPEHVIQASREWPKYHGPVMKYFQGTSPHILCTDPDLVQKIQSSEFKTFPDRRVPFWMCGLNKEDRERPLWEIFFARGKRWTAIRRAADPLFHANAMKSYMPIFKLAVQRFLAKLEESKPGESLEIVHPLKDLGLEVIGASVFGVDFQSQGKERIPLAHATGYLSTPEHHNQLFTLLLLTFPHLKHIFGWIIGNFLMHVPLFKYSSTNAGYVDGASKVLLKNSRRAKGLDPLEGQPPDNETYESANPFRKSQMRAEARAAEDLKDAVPADNCLFTKLQTAELKEDGGRRLTDKEIAYQGTIFVTAGHETSALTMAYAMFELAQKPHYQDKIREEVRAFEKTVEPGHEFTYNDLKHFRYARACIEETMRKHPPVNCHLGSARIPAKDTMLAGFFIPKGVPVVCNSFGMVRDPKIFPRPDEFLPERFLEESDIGPHTWHQYAHIPFGAGPHKCIGARFATDEAALAIASFIRRYRYALDPEKHPAGSELAFHCGVTVIPKGGGIWIKLDKVLD